MDKTSKNDSKSLPSLTGSAKNENKEMINNTKVNIEDISQEVVDKAKVNNESNVKSKVINKNKRQNPFDDGFEINNLRDFVNNVKYLESSSNDLIEFERNRAYFNDSDNKISINNDESIKDKSSDTERSNKSKESKKVDNNKDVLIEIDPSSCTSTFVKSKTFTGNKNDNDRIKTSNSNEITSDINSTGENKINYNSADGSISSLDGIHPSRIVNQIQRDRKKERLNDALLTAVYDSKPIEDVKKLLDKGAEILTSCRDNGASVLHVAALNADPEMAEFLISKGADVKARDKSGKQAVHVAAWEGALSVLQVICKIDNTTVNSKIKVEDPYVIEHPDSWNHKHDQLNRYWQVMEIINEGSSPLHVACRRTKESCVKYLIESGANIVDEDSKGLYPVDVIGMNVGEDPVNRTASDSSEGSLVGIAKLLIGHQKRNSEVDLKTDGQPTKGWLKVIRLFSGKDHDVRPVTALHTAVNDNNLNLIKILLDEGADVLAWNKDGLTPLHLAVKKKFEDALSLMLRYGDNKAGKFVNAVDTRTRTLLHLAVEEEWTDGISLLLEENADITCKTEERQTVLHIVARNGNIKILNELLTVPESSKIINAIDNDCYAPIHKSVENNHLKSMELLIKKGAKADVLLPDGRTLLHMVAKHNYVDLLQSLMTLLSILKLKENKTSIGEGGMTALHIAASHGHGDIVDLLLKYGCDLAAKTADDGSTPLHLAAKNDKIDIINRILEYDRIGSTLEYKDNHGWYPLHIAAGHGNEECVDLLLRSGADIAFTVQDEQGTVFTALDIIMTCVHKPVNFLVRILDSYIIVDDQVPVTNPQCKIEVDFDFILPKCTDGKQFGVLEAVLNNGNDSLEEAIFLHPIVQTFIHLKSKNLFLFFALFFDLFFLLAFYLSAIAYHGAFTLREPVYRYILIGILSMNMLAEVINVVRLQRYYIKDAETWIKWCVYFNVMFIVIHPTDLVFRYNMAVSILLSWTELLLIIAKYPAWGIYVLMFTTVAATILKVLAVFSLLLIGFAFTFRALFQEQGPFNSIWSSMVKIIIMVYELDYRGTMEEMNNEGETFANVARGLYLVFVLMVSVSLVNLMLGLAISDITELKRKGGAKRLAKQAAFLGGLENLLYSWPLDSFKWTRSHRSVPPILVVKAGSKLTGGSDSPVPRYLKEIIIEKARSVQQSKQNNQQINVDNKLSDETSSVVTRKISTKQNVYQQNDDALSKSVRKISAKQVFISKQTK